MATKSNADGRMRPGVLNHEFNTNWWSFSRIANSKTNLLVAGWFFF
jgi:hypothetical protein